MNGDQKEITIDILAVMIQKGFMEVRQDINALEEKMNQRVDALEEKMNQRVDALEEKMNFRFNGVQNQLDNIYLNYIQRHEHAELKERIVVVERKVGIVYKNKLRR